MDNPQEPTVPAGDFVEVAGENGEVARFPPAEVTPAPPEPAPEPAPEPPVTPEPEADFTLSTLENGQREMRLATGQVYKGKDDQELYAQLAKAQISASKRISELSKAPEPAPVAEPAPAAIDPTALAMADLLAPAFGAKSAKELIEAFQAQQQAAAQMQELTAAQQINAEASKFFLAVPEFSKTPQDAEKIDNYLQEAGIPFSAKTAEMAYHTLKAKGELSAPAQRTPTGQFAAKNIMPPPPAGSSPASTGKGAPTETDLWNMTPEQLLEIATQSA